MKTTKERIGFAGTIGDTPLILLESLSKATGCKIYGKAEHLNPGGSVKDRPAKYLIEQAEKEGKLKPGGWIVEGTAGNTGVGLCLVGAVKGYKCLFVCPDKTSTDKIELLRTLGAQVEVVPSVSSEHENHFSKVAKRRADELGGFFTNQFENPCNMLSHYETTGREIWEQTGGKLDAVVMACGTGGTCAGCTRYLKEKNSNVRCYVIDPQGQSLKYTLQEDNTIKVSIKTEEDKKNSKSNSTASVLEGIGSGRLHYSLEQMIIDGAFAGDDQLALEMVQYLLKHEGLFLGGSAGLNVLGALWAAKHLGTGHTIVTILCDSGHNYKRNSIYSIEWRESKNVHLRRTTLQEILDAYDPETHLVIHKREEEVVTKTTIFTKYITEI